MGSNYQIAFDKAMADLQAKDPMKVCANAVADYSADSGQYCVPFFERPFIADIKNGEVYEKSTGIRCDPFTGILILHYLTYAQDITPSGQWITLKEIPYGGALFYPAFKKEVLDAVNTFQYDLAAFDRAAAALNGKKLSMGDSGAVLPLSPNTASIVIGSGRGIKQLGFCLTVLSVFLTLETIIGFGYYLGHNW